MKKLFNILLLIVLPVMLAAQSRTPLIPSKRNDRLMEQRQQAEEAEAKAAEARRRADSTATATPAAVDTPFVAGDSSIWAPLQVHQLGVDNYDQLTAPLSPLDLKDPGNIQQSVDFEPSTGYYVLHTRIGDVDITTPYLMTIREYNDYSEQQQMHRYWQQKISEVEHNNETKFNITDMKFNIGPADKIFGPGGVQLKMQGSAELLFGFKHQYIANPSLTEKSRNNNVFDFNEKINVNVNGKVGDKLNFNMGYNTEASFSFDQQNIKLNYKGQEDDIIQSLEAGNVTLDLNSSLIRGSKALFGVKTNLQFGKLKIQAVLSQQNSESQTVSSKGGAQMTQFDVTADSYDENRHFFLSYFFRDQYERAMQTVPYIASGVTINKIEVWVTNKRGNYEQARNLVAFVDLGETGDHLMRTDWQAGSGKALPSNNTNQLYVSVKDIDGVRDIQQTGAVLQGFHQMEAGDDYEKIESARLLTSSEYTLNSALGYISLKSALNQDEVLAVAYEYTYNGQVYQVGEFSTDDLGDGVPTGGQANNQKAPTLLLKMLKSSANAPVKKGSGTWDLMMKNIYSLGATSISSDKFELYITYRNDSIGTEMQYLTEGNIKGQQLLRVMQLDRLDSKNNATHDGRFDYLEGLTVYSSNGRIIFPVLEPFGSHLRRILDDDQLAQKYCFPELYDSTLVTAQEYTEKNKFHLTGKYKGTSGSEIRLGAMNVPRGSVTVTAGGAILLENVDYTVDYTMGTVTILNQSILESGTNVDVKLENQSTFSLQQKSLFGAHLEYQFNKDLMIGGTIMHLRERPLTTKVNTGQEPLANTIWGVNGSWKTEMQWLTNAIDKIPWITATQPSTFSINAEFAHLIPGHTRDVGQAGTAYIDDFEYTTTSIDVHYPSYWYLSATPSRFDESKLSNDIRYGRNRALLNWYTIDPIFGYPQSNTPPHIKSDVEAMSDHRTRIIYEQEVYPNKEQLANQDTKLAVLNLSFYPDQRGPYNIVGHEIGSNGRLTNPRSRWGGMMRRLDNTDFEKANIEYIEFWMMDPALTNPDGYEGKLYINLGDVSEDILRDGKKAFEHGMPISDSDLGRVDTTIWGLVPRTTSTVTAFSNEAGSRAKQDVGLNGLSSRQELQWGKYAEYISYLRDTLHLSQTMLQPFIDDPAGDDFHYYRGTDYDNQEVPILDRYLRYNGVEGNSPDTEQQTERYGTAATLQPDVEDINRDNTLNEYEKYFEYCIDLRPSLMQVGQQYISEKKESKVTLRNGQQQMVTWYQFKIPVRSGKAVGSIRNFKSIRFMRLYMTDCPSDIHLRLATLDLVRGEWRVYSKPLIDTAAVSVNPFAELDVQAINIEENSTREPINYILPPGVSRQTDPGQAQLIAQNEQSLILRTRKLSPHDARAIYKNTHYDMRQYKRLQMFVHAEKLSADDPDLQSGDLSCFIRLGSDLKNNYYEYEIPLSLTDSGRYNNDNIADRRLVWPDENMFDFPFKALTDVKMARNKAKRSGNNIMTSQPYFAYDVENGKPQNKISVVGNPTLEDVECIMIGVRNHSTHVASGEIWVNELRLSQFNEQGGVAAMANASLAISDIAQVNVAGRLETAGYGSIESNVLDRNIDNSYQLSVSAALEAGRLFPEKAKIQMPLYVAYTNQTLSPDYDPLDSDIKLKETLDSYDSKEAKDSIRQMSNTVQESTSFSVTNMKVNIHSKKRDMFYDPANFSISASYNKQEERSPEMERNMTTDQKGSFNYAYSFNPKPWEPFAKVEKVQKIKFFKEFNIFYLPQSWAFSTNMHRAFSHMKMRDLAGDGSTSPDDITFSKDFTWDRNVDIKYDLTRNMKFSFQSAMNASIDEGYWTPEILRQRYFTDEFNNDKYEAWRDTIQHSLAKWGNPYTYQQVFTATWNVPFNRIPYIEALSANASYNATYNWQRTMLRGQQDGIDRGNTISSVQSWQIDGGINLETLYGKSKYWKALSTRYTGRRNTRPFKPKTFEKTVKVEKDKPLDVNHRLASDNLEVIATDSLGHKVAITWKPDGSNKISLTAKQDCDALKLSISTRDPNKRNAGQVAMDMAAYIGTMIRRVQVTYRETNSMSVPGFSPEAGFMGQRQTEKGVFAPGFNFAFGFVPNDFIRRAQERGWLSGDTTVVQPATRAKTSDLDIKITLEPLPGLKVQMTGKRYLANSTSIIYSYGDLQENMTGSFNITQVAAATAFGKIGSQETNFQNDTYDLFVENIGAMQSRIQAIYDDSYYPTTGFMQQGNASLSAGQKYDRQNGTVSRSSADVLIPAFLAAYTGKDISRISMNPFLGILNVLPNWSITYDGLGKLPWMRDHFRAVTLTHAYTCKYAIGSYGSYSTWVPMDGHSGDKTMGFVRNVTTDMPTPSSAYDISSVTLTEAFSPLIGLNLSMKNSLTCKVEYRKQRNLALNITSVQLTEGHTNELVIGGGYTIKNLNFVAKNKNGGEKKVSNDLKLSVDVSYKDVKMLLRKVEEGITQASSGNKVLGIKISADYVLSQKINLQLFYDHQGTTPLISTSYPVKADNVGLNIKLMLTR